ncbi:MAG: Ig-like domain-containing protein [Gemmatimonadaceae bacterium]
MRAGSRRRIVVHRFSQAAVVCAAIGCGAADINGLPRILVVSGDALVLTVGQRDSLWATIEGPPLITAEWQSRNPAVATVTAQGVITAVSPGRTHVIAGSGGDRDSASVTVRSPDALPQMRYSIIAAGGAHTCAITESVRAMCWGSNWHGELGFGRPIRFRSTMSPMPVATGSFTALDVSTTNTCALGADRRIYCWGDNLYGQLGDGGRSTRAAPEPVRTDLRFAAVSVGGAMACGLTDAGEASCWGQIGSRQESLPVRIQTAARLKVISAGGMHGCGITLDGTLECWGRNDLGQLGDGTKEPRVQPVRVEGNERFRSVSAGYVHTCAISESDAVYCWGDNFDGRLGIGTQAGTSSPTRVSIPDGAREVSAGNVHSCAVTLRDEAYCWGDNIYAQLGNGHPPGQSAADYKELSPVKVTAAGIRFRTITAGGQHTCALSTEGEAFCWGFSSGQLGIGYRGSYHPSSFPLRTVPTRIADSPTLP